jgi:phage shock protein PspC (stress-responsive transcriptional regulator)
MKKTLTINLGGIFFHIDEDAYLLLNQYLDSLKKYFSRQDGSSEILEDIESRIAEILNSKRTETKQVITLEDVNMVMAIMGQPVEIDQEENPKMKQDSPGGEKGEKRFFRNPDEKVIAGVCSGIAAYFHLDPVWVRLIFVVFVAAGGSGILLYIVMWLVIPEAQTTTDRLEMRGKKINISNIEKSMREEVSELGNRIGDMTSASAATIRQAGKGTGSMFEMIGKSIAGVLKVIGKGLVILTGALLILTGLGILLALLAYTLGWTGGIYSDNDFTVLSFPALAKILIGCNMPVMYLQVIVLMVLGIPLFMLFYNGLRMVFRFDRIRHLGLTMFNIWVVGLFFLAWSGLKIYHLYQFEEKKQIEIGLENPASDTLFVSMFTDDPGMRYLRNEQFNLVGDLKTIISDEKELYVVPKIVIEQSNDSLFSISQVSLARGKTRLEAHQHLTGIRFQSATSGSALKISPFLRLPKEECWRGQIIDVVIRIPKGKFIRFDRDFQALRPFWYYRMDSSGESTFQMTDNGLEINPGEDTAKAKRDTTSTDTVRKQAP